MSQQQLIRAKTIVPRDKRVTSDTLTIYELTPVVSMRISMLGNGCPSYIQSATDDFKQVAIREILEKKCPLSITRETSRGIEVWEVNEMIVNRILIGMV